jgi:hypothetical protein
MEARPDSPGHVGYTPQPVPAMRFAAREAGVRTSGLVCATIELARPIAAQVFPRLASPRKRATVADLLALERHRQTRTRLQPWPVDFREGFRAGTAPRGPE